MKKSLIILSVIVITSSVFIQSCSTTRYSTGDKPMEKIENSKQYKKEKFVNYMPGGLETNFFKFLSCLSK